MEINRKEQITKELIQGVKKLDGEGKLAAAAFAKGIAFALEITGHKPGQETGKQTA